MQGVIPNFYSLELGPYEAGIALLAPVIYINPLFPQ